KMDPALLEAASDLGASQRQTFWLVTFPLSLPGVGAGGLLWFIPIVGEFVIPDLLAGCNSLLIGQTLWLEFFTHKDSPVASSATLATVLGTLAAVALSRGERFRGRTLFSGMLYAPLVMPEVITGLSLLLLFVAIDAERGFWTVTTAHTTLTMCFVAVVVQSRL